MIINMYNMFSNLINLCRAKMIEWKHRGNTVTEQITKILCTKYVIQLFNVKNMYVKYIY